MSCRTCRCDSDGLPAHFRSPLPVRGGSIEEFRPLFNLPDDDSWVLLVGFLVGALHPAGPYIVLVSDR